MPTSTRKRAPARRAGTPARRSPPRRRAVRRRQHGPFAAALEWLGLPAPPVLTQRQRDLGGLALIAVGIFLGFVLYGHGDGGVAGRDLDRAFAYLFGAVRYAAPVAFAGGGVALLLAPVLPELRALRTGSLCVFAATELALAAGTLGLGPSGRRHGFFVQAFFERRGGIVGEGLFWAAQHLVSNLGAHIIALFLFVAGILLLTGASIAGVLRATGEGLADTTRALRVALGEHTQAPAEPFVPEPSGEVIVRATHVEAPSRELFDGADEVDPPPEEQPPADDLEEAAGPSETPAVAVDPPPGEQALTPQGRFRRSALEDGSFNFKIPSAERLLLRSGAEQSRPDTAGQERTAQRLIEALGHFGVESHVIGTVAGPHITRYELRLAPGTKVAKVAQLKDDLAYALAATDIRILAPIPGKQAVGVEVPNARRRIVRLGDVFQDPPPDWSPLTVWLGKDIAGKAIGADLSKMPHLLVAGTTGSGKSGAINAMLSSVLLRATPHQVRMVLVDPKQVELNHYESIPHLLTPVITSPRMAANALANLVREMEQRYGIMSLARTRSLVELNRVRAKRGEQELPYILCVIDELSDLMMVAPADVEDAIIRLAQKARAVGIHLVLATQTPRVDVITGMIKANVPSRIAFAVSSQTDSRVILDVNGAESLLGQGDMLFSPVGTSRLQRIQGAYIDEGQIEKLTDFWRRQGEPEFREELLEEVEPLAGEEGGGDEFDPDEDPLLADAIQLVAEMQTASTSMLQRRLRLGYTRAGRLIDMLERRGVISGYEGSKPRQVLIGEGDVARVLAALDRGGRAAAPGAAPGVAPGALPGAAADAGGPAGSDE